MKFHLLHVICLLIPLQTSFAYPNAVPQGFIIDDVAGNLGIVTDFTFLDPQRMLVARKLGEVVMVQNGGVSHVVLDLKDKVGSCYGDRGLIGIEVHPQYPQVPFLYVGYVYDNNPGDQQGRKYNRLSRFNLIGTDNPAGVTADKGSELILLGECKLPKVKDWYGDDCSPMHGTTHSIDWIKFGQDGKLWVSIGDGQTFEGTDWEPWVGYDFNGPMNLDFLGGKILRLDPVSGNGLEDNPFWNGNPTSARSRVWANGIRQPFRCDFIPNAPTGTELLCGNVGWYTVESVLWFTRGSNAGWPCWEGGQKPPGNNPGTPSCQQYYNGQTDYKGFVPEAAPYNYYHNGQSAASIGGVFFPADKWPAPYANSFIFADFPSSKVMALQWDIPNSRPVGWAVRNDQPIQPLTIATGADQPVRFRVAADGSIYYIGHCVSCSKFGIMRRMWYNGTVAVAPDPKQQEQNQLEVQGLVGPIVVTDKTKNMTANPMIGDGKNATAPTEPDGCNPLTADIVQPLPKTWDSVMYVGQFVNTLFARNGLGPIELDANNGGQLANDGTSISIGGVRFSKGIGTGTTSEVHVGLNGHCYRFKSFVGIDDAAAPGAQGEFIVKLDGQIFWNSTVWNRGSALANGDAPLSIDIAGLQNVSMLSLYGMKPWANAMPSSFVSYMSWGDAKIYCGPDAPLLPSVEITNPPMKNKYGLGETVTFAGRAFDGITQQPLPDAAYTWYVNLLHCQGALCHTHFYQQFAGVTAGTFQIVPHALDNDQQYIFYELRLVVQDGCERTNYVSRSVIVG